MDTINDSENCLRELEELAKNIPENFQKKDRQAFYNTLSQCVEKTKSASTTQTKQIQAEGGCCLLI